MESTDRYTVDLDWVWGPENPDLQGVATIRVTIMNPERGRAQREVDAWFSTFELGEGNARWQGGWSVEAASSTPDRVLLDLRSGGQDVAESLSEAVAALQDALVAPGTTLTWDPQPISHDGP